MHVAYRQMPETGADGSTEDCLTAYRWLLAQGVDAAKIVFGGDSAGGFLAFATALRAVERGIPAPAGIFAQSGL